MCIIAPVSPIGRDDTRAPYKASDPHERERCQLPGIRIEPIDFLRKDLKRFKVLKPNGGLDVELESLRTAGATRQVVSWSVQDDNFTVRIAFVPPPDVSLQDLRQKISCRLTPMEMSSIQSPRPSPLKESKLSRHVLGRDVPSEMHLAMGFQLFPRAASGVEKGILRHFEEITRDAQWRQQACVGEGGVVTDA